MVGRKFTAKSKGFTLLELIMMTVIVVILAFLGWRSYKVSGDSEREALVRVNMRVAQIAAQSYFNDAGNYPPDNSDPAYLSYFPGGSNDQKGTRAGNFPINPFTHRPEAPQLGHITDVGKARGQAPKLIGEPGQIFYSPITVPGADKASSFAIQGSDRYGRCLTGPKPNTSLVLSDH